ncbi:MAG: flippase-like domain-containing protein [Bacteroidales bacterium]|nr:flippase-like domain-containing protein [Bacteroidales bacterium]
MKAWISRVSKVLFFILLSLFFLYLAFRKVEFREITDALVSANYSWLLLSFLFTMLAFFSRARRWVLMIRPLGYRPGLINTYHSMMTGYLVNFALPRAGEVSKCIALGRKENIPVNRLIGTVIVERTFDLLSLIIILIITLMLPETLMATFINQNIIDPLRIKAASSLNISSLIVIVILSTILLGTFLVILFRKKLSHSRVVDKTGGFLRGIADGLRSFYAMENKPEFIFHTIFMWANYAMMAWVIVFMTPATSFLKLSDSLFLLVTGSLGMAAPVQGGIGAYHWIMSRGLLFVYDIPLSDGLVYATLAHESQLILIALLGAFSFYRLFGSTRGLKELTDTRVFNKVITEKDNDGKK